MNQTERLILAYRTAEFSESGESASKVQIISELEAYLPAREVLEFMLAILRNPDEYDLAHIEICRALACADAAGEINDVVGEALATCLVAEDDVLVRQWLANASAAFADVPALYERLLACVADPDEDISVRHSALLAIDRRGPTDHATETLKSIATVDHLGWSVEQVLVRWEGLGGDAG
jgi:hypothetical protein